MSRTIKAPFVKVAGSQKKTYWRTVRSRQRNQIRSVFNHIVDLEDFHVIDSKSIVSDYEYI